MSSAINFEKHDVHLKINSFPVETSSQNHKKKSPFRRSQEKKCTPGTANKIRKINTQQNTSINTQQNTKK